MAADSKDTRAQARLEKAARENDVSMDYEVEAKIVREKTARLRALRLAKEAADNAGTASKASRKPAKAGKKPAKTNASLADWLADQNKSGRRY
jgi:hypothetical protein